MSKLDALKAEVEKVKSVELSAITLIQGLSSKLKDALEADDTEQAVSELVAELDASSVALAAAVSGASTPAVGAGGATSVTSSPALADLPPDHPLAPATEPAPPPDAPKA